MTSQFISGWTPARRFVTVDGVRLHCAVDGPTDAPVLALANPASHNLTCWEVVLPRLLEHFRVLRFDLRGTGRSGWGTLPDFCFPRYADDLAGLLDALGIERAFVLGVAYGARSAAHFALRHADRLSALGLFDVALTPPVVQTGQRALGEQARALLVDAGMASPPAAKYWRFYQHREAARLAHTAHERDTDCTARLASVTAPALVACGRQDMNLVESMRIAATLPNARHEVMEMTGHGSPFFRPALFCELIENFYAAVG